VVLRRRTKLARGIVIGILRPLIVTVWRGRPWRGIAIHGGSHGRPSAHHIGRLRGHGVRPVYRTHGRLRSHSLRPPRRRWPAEDVIEDSISSRAWSLSIVWGPRIFPPLLGAVVRHAKLCSQYSGRRATLIRWYRCRAGEVFRLWVVGCNGVRRPREAGVDGVTIAAHRPSTAAGCCNRGCLCAATCGEGGRTAEVVDRGTGECNGDEECSSAAGSQLWEGGQRARRQRDGRKEWRVMRYTGGGRQRWRYWGR
jgi:hypothetical protein